MRIFIPRAGCGSLHLSQSISRYLLQIVQTSIVVYSMLAAPEQREKAETGLNTILGNYNTSPGQSVVRERERGEYNSLVLL